MNTVRTGNAQIKNVPDGIQLCNFGSSHGLSGFNYENYLNKFVCYNFGQGSQFISYDYRILQNYIDKFEPGAIVIIVISHFSLFGPPDTTYENFQALNKRYYKFMDDSLIKEYDAKTDFYVNYAPSLAADSVEDLIKTLLGNGGSDSWAIQTSAAEAKDHGYNRYKAFVEDKLNENGERWYNEEEINALYDMIDYCKAHELVPVMVTTPYLSEYNNAIKENDPEFYDDFYGLINRISEETNTPYFDYSGDERFTYDYTLFVNSDHLNRAGAKLFTQILLENLQQ